MTMLIFSILLTIHLLFSFNEKYRRILLPFSFKRKWLLVIIYSIIILISFFITSYYDIEYVNIFSNRSN